MEDLSNSLKLHEIIRKVYTEDGDLDAKIAIFSRMRTIDMRVDFMLSGVGRYRRCTKKCIPG